MRVGRRLACLCFVLLVAVALQRELLALSWAECHASTGGIQCTAAKGGDSCFNWYWTCVSTCDSQQNVASFLCSDSETTVSCRCEYHYCTPDNGSCSSNGECCNEGCYNGVCAGPSPVLIDLRQDDSNYDLSSAEDGVRFDIAAHGTPVQVSWTERGTDVAFLSLDRNGNGRIDDGAELFGTSTPLEGGGRAANGFDALVEFDGNHDGRIDGSDGVYSTLRLWLDKNHNGVSEQRELHGLSSAGVTAIYTDYREGRRVDRNGNQFRFVGKALVTKNRRSVPRRIFDVFLVTLPD